MKRKQGIRLLLTGGGTGGHVYPILAIYDLLRREMGVSEALYVGSRGRAEEKIIPRTNLPLRFVQSAPVSGLGPWQLVPSVWKNLIGTLQAALILLRFRPQMILASGGYVSAPVTFASFLLRPLLGAPLVIEEQNVMPGLMNKVASLFARLVMVSFPETPYFLWNNRCVYTGYPVRAEILTQRPREEIRRELGIHESRFVILVYGGSLGSRSINRLMTGVAGQLPAGRDIQIIHAAGLSTGEYDAWSDSLHSLKDSCPPGTEFTPAGDGFEAAIDGRRILYRLQPYLHNLAEYLAACDLVVCRAGAGAITEICAAAKPAIVIPKRGLPGDHQEHNAIRLAENDGCEVVFERRRPDGVDFVDPAEFLAILERIVSRPQRLQMLAASASQNFHAKFSEIILETVRGVLGSRPMDYVPNVVEPRSVQILKQVDLLVEFLRKQPAGSFYRRLYGIKMEEYLQASDWKTINNGIKLIGALQRADRIPDLVRHFDSGNGFMRRNVLRALDHLGICVPEVPGLLTRALSDPYFEVRAAAFAVAGRYAPELRDHEELGQQMRARMCGRLHFDERLQALHVLPSYLPIADYMKLADRFRFCENARLRQAILDGIRIALNRGRIGAGDMETTRRFINEMLITTSDFVPQFSIRTSFVELHRALSEKIRTEAEPRP
jgi:UDP-N-acetylglucosamine--N-acetylmuramyl-(pentapeptide) pyrophosphoryl-undecaprenol N-acetylglucosamine transferase